MATIQEAPAATSTEPGQRPTAHRIKAGADDARMQLEFPPEINGKWSTLEDSMARTAVTIYADGSSCP